MISNDEKFRKDLHITEKLCQYDRNYGIQSHISNFPIYLSWSCHVVVWYLDQILMSSQYRLSAATSTIIKINHSSEGCQWVCAFVFSLTPPKRRTLMSWNVYGWFPLGRVDGFKLKSIGTDSSVSRKIKRNRVCIVLPYMIYTLFIYH